MNNYYSLSEPNEEQERSLYSQQIKRMLSQVSTTTSNFLDQLTYIYKSNGINFRIKQFHGILMRMLSPFELLSHFGLDDNQQLFLKNGVGLSAIRQNVHMKKNRIFRRKQNFQYQPIVQNSIRNNYNFGGSDKYQSLAQKIRLAPETTPKNYYQIQQNQEKKQLKVGRQPVLGSEVQAKLCDWIRDQVVRNKTISHVAITEQARKLSNNQTFLGSSGWFKRFTKRNPQMKKFLQMYKNNNMQQTKVLDGKINTLVVSQKDGENQFESYGKIQRNGLQGDWYGVYDQNQLQNNQYTSKVSKQTGLKSRTKQYQSSEEQNLQFELVSNHHHQQQKQNSIKAKITKIKPSIIRNLKASQQIRQQKTKQSRLFK